MFVDITFTLVVAGVACLLGLTALLLLSLRLRAKVPLGKPPSLLRTLVVFAVTMALVSFVARDIRNHLQRQQPPRAEDTDQPLARQGIRPQAQRQGHRPQVIWPLALAVGGLAAAAILAALVVSRRRASAGELSDEALADIRAALDQAIDDLRREPDLRKAIIAAYARMERVLSAYGLGRHPAETPYEYLGRIAAELEAQPSLAALTELFERAKFSLAAVDERMRAAAIDALTAVRNDVRATA